MNAHKEMYKHLEFLKNGFMVENRDELLKSFNQFAKSNRQLVLKTISGVHPSENEIFWNFLESICDELCDWSDFIAKQFTRLLFAAEEMENPYQVINSLEAFNLIIQKHDTELMKRIKNIIKMFLNTPQCHLKRFLVWMFTLCIYETNKSELNIIRRLIYDKDVIIRYYAIITYNSLKGLPVGRGLTPLDRLILSISDVYVCRDVTLKSVLNLGSLSIQ